MKSPFDVLQQNLEADGYTVQRLKPDVSVTTTASSKSSALRAVKQLERILLQYPGKAKGAALVALWGLVGVLKNVIVGRATGKNVRIAVAAALATIAKSPMLLAKVGSILRTVFKKVPKTDGVTEDVREFAENVAPEPESEPDDSSVDDNEDLGPLADDPGLTRPADSGDYLDGLPDPDASIEDLTKSKPNAEKRLRNAVNQARRSAKRGTTASVIAIASEEGHSKEDLENLAADYGAYLKAHGSKLKGIVFLYVFGIYELVRGLLKAHGQDLRATDNAKATKIAINPAVKASLKVVVAALRKSTTIDKPLAELVERTAAFC